MARCGIQKGFFVLRSCHEITDTICPACRRPSCAAHSRPIGEPPDNLHCVECFARYKATGSTDAEAKPAAGSGTANALDSLDDTWSYGYRDRYYRGSGYRPLLHGSYVDQDFRSFDHDASEAIGAEEDETGGSLMDS